METALLHLVHSTRIFIKGLRCDIAVLRTRRALTEIVFYLLILHTQYPLTVLAANLSRIGGGGNADSDANSLLREREMTTNVAFNKYADLWPSSTNPYRSSLAIDGKLDGACTRVYQDSKHRNTWWNVYLKDVYEIWAVVIYRCSK